MNVYYYYKSTTDEHCRSQYLIPSLLLFSASVQCNRGDTADEKINDEQTLGTIYIYYSRTTTTIAPSHRSRQSHICASAETRDERKRGRGTGTDSTTSHMLLTTEPSAYYSQENGLLMTDHYRTFFVKVVCFILLRRCDTLRERKEVEISHLYYCHECKITSTCSKGNKKESRE